MFEGNDHLGDSPLRDTTYLKNLKHLVFEMLVMILFDDMNVVHLRPLLETKLRTQRLNIS